MRLTMRAWDVRAICCQRIVLRDSFPPLVAQPHVVARATVSFLGGEPVPAGTIAPAYGQALHGLSPDRSCVR